tara:strand:- start:295 stop:438 length:144 start_codon:yes stop_codon:yes gene_type:complete
MVMEEGKRKGASAEGMKGVSGKSARSGIPNLIETNLCEERKDGTPQI